MPLAEGSPKLAHGLRPVAFQPLVKRSPILNAVVEPLHLERGQALADRRRFLTFGKCSMAFSTPCTSVQSAVWTGTPVCLTLEPVSWFATCGMHNHDGHPSTC